MIYELVGKKFGKWKVLEKSTLAKKSRDRLWKCKCECGRIGFVKTYHLTKGYSKKCSYCGVHDTHPYDQNIIPLPIWNRIISNAKKRKIPFEVSSDYAYKLYLEQNKKCKLSGLYIEFPKTGTDLLKKMGTSSLDRIDSTKGYVEGNIQWVHKDINKMKNNFDEKYFIDLCKLVGNKK